MEISIEKREANIMTLKVELNYEVAGTPENVDETITEATKNALIKYKETLFKETCDDILYTGTEEVLGNKDGKFIFYIPCAVTPSEELGQYKELVIEGNKSEVTDEEIDNYIESVLRERSTLIEITDGVVENGHTANIDFKGFVDGEAFEGGAGEGFDLGIGSGTFIPGFEEQLIGCAVGEEKDVVVRFPDQYVPELAGKEAVFKCKVNAIKKAVLAELTDEFVQSISECKTVDEWKGFVKDEMNLSREMENTNINDSKLIEKAISNTEISIPIFAFEQKINQLMDEFSAQLRMQRLDLDKYLELAQISKENLIDQMTPRAQAELKMEFILSAIAKAEGITVTDEEVEDTLRKLASTYGMKFEDLMGAMDDIGNQMRKDIRGKKALGVILETAIIK